MTILNISQDALIMLPDGSTGGTVQISYNGTTVGPVIASGDGQGRAVIVQGRLAKLTALDGKSPLQIVGREAGGRLPARVTLRIYPEGSATVAPIILSGLPVGSPDAPGIWDLSNIDDASGGMDVILPGERQAIAVLRERAASAADQAEAAAQSASGAEAKAAATIGQLQSSISSAAQAAAAGTVARVDAALADTAQTASQLAQQQEGNNAQTAQLLGRLTVANTVALAGAAAGTYTVTSGTEAGQVWEIMPDGRRERRPGLEAASKPQLDNLNLKLPRIITPEMHGAVGDGVADDRLAFGKMCAAYTSGDTILLTGRYRIAGGEIPGLKYGVGVIELWGHKIVDVDFAHRGEILMDNLVETRDSNGNLTSLLGGGYGGIYIVGNGDPDSRCTIRNRPKVTWTRQPFGGAQNGRSQGDGIMVVGYPEDGGPTYLNSLLIDHPEITNAPQASVICMGVSSPHLINPRAWGGRADAFHFNACRYPVITGTAQAEDCQDDVTPLVSYHTDKAHPERLGDNPREPWAIPGPVGEWHNGYGSIQKTVAINCHANSTRLAGAYKASVGPQQVVGGGFGVQTDAAVRTADGAVAWTYLASVGCTVASIDGDGTTVPFLATVLGDYASQPKPEWYTQFDVNVGSIRARGVKTQSQVRVTKARGLSFGRLDLDGDLEVNAGGEVRVDYVKCRDVLLTDALPCTLNEVDARRVSAVRSQVVRGLDWSSTNAPGDAFYIEATTVEGPYLHAKNANRQYDPKKTDNPVARVLLLSGASRTRLRGMDVDMDANPIKLMEIGGSSVEKPVSDIQLGVVAYVSPAPLEVITQGGPAAIKNYSYDLRWRKPGETGITRTEVNTYPPAPRPIFNSFLDVDYAMSGAKIPLRAVTQQVGMSSNGDEGLVFVQQPGVYAVTIAYDVQMNGGDRYNVYLQVNQQGEVTKYGFGNFGGVGTLRLGGTRYVELKAGDSLRLVADIPDGRVVSKGGGVSVAMV